MTVLVGVRCSDGVVIGADSMATSTAGVFPLVQLPANEKIQIFSDEIIVAATGAVGLSQRLMVHVEAAIQGNVFKNLKTSECIGNISQRFMQDCQKTAVPFNPQHGIGFGALLAATIKGEACLVEYDTRGFQPELKLGKLFFVSMGSGQTLAEPFLAFVARVLWKETVPTVDQAKFGVFWALHHAIRYAPGGVGGDIKLASLRQAEGKWKAQMIDTEEAGEYIAELEQHISEFATKRIEEAEAKKVPTPPPQQ